MTKVSYIVLLLCFLAVSARDAMAEQAQEEQVVERVIKIEGTIERPRVIFIVPRAKLRREGKEDALKKSFIAGILAPVYPEDLIKEEIKNTVRR